MSAEDLLDYFTALKGISKSSRKRKAIVKFKITNLYEVRHKLVLLFWQDKQRFRLHNYYQINIVDEPTAGLDPAEDIVFKCFYVKLVQIVRLFFPIL
jgi:ABC-type multidrug transport system ATPase subunit